MAQQARSDTVTPDVLTNQADRSKRPIVTYLDDDESPEYVIRATKLIIGDGDDSARQYPTREAQLVVTDTRLLVLVGKRRSDDIYEMPLSTVTDIYIDEVDLPTRYVIVDANRAGEPMTFFADVTVESDLDAVESTVRFVRSRADLDPDVDLRSPTPE